MQTTLLRWIHKSAGATCVSRAVKYIACAVIRKTSNYENTVTQVLIREKRQFETKPTTSIVQHVRLVCHAEME